MTEKELQRMRRTELLEVLLEQSRENERLRDRVSILEDEINDLSEQLRSRSIKMEKAGTMAEAALLVNGVIEATEAAAAEYLENLRSYSTREEVNCKRREEETERIVEKMLADAQARCDALISSTEDRCAAMTYVAQQQCDFMKDDARQFCEDLETETRKKCDALEELTKNKCDSLEKQTEERCATLGQKTQENTAKCWEDVTNRMEEFYKIQESLRNLFGNSGWTPKN